MIQVFLSVLAFFMLLPVFAEAGPVAGAISAVAGFLGVSAGVVALAAINLAISATMSVIQRNKMKKAQKNSDGGIRIERRMTGGVNSRTLVLGFYATAGCEVCPPMSQGTSSTPNNHLTIVVSLSDCVIEGISRIIIDGEYVPIDWETIDYYGARIKGKHEGRAWIRFYDGTQTEADPMLLERFSDYPDRPWSSKMVGKGCAYAIVTFKYDTKLYRQEPVIKFELFGAKLYDPRKDSSRGGSGAHRLDNPATWEYTDNPIVIDYNTKLGIKLGDGRVYGAKADVDEVPLENWVAAMNVCDEEVPKAGGGTEKRYRCGYEVFVADDEPADVTDQLLLACAGQQAEIGGIYKVRAGGPGLPVAFFTDGDFLVSRPSDFDPFPGIAKSRNTINATFPHPEELWVSHDAPQRTVAEYLAEDDGEVIATHIALSAVPFFRQVQRNMFAWLKDDRRWRSHFVTVGPYGFALEPLDVIEWTSVANGYDGKLFDIEKTKENLYNLCHGLNFREVDPNDYSWNSGFELPDPVTPGGWQLPEPQGVPGFTVVPIAIRDENDVARRPGIQVNWTPGMADDATALLVTVEHISSGQRFEKTIANIDRGTDVIDQGLLPDQLYRVQAEYQVKRPTVPSSWLEVRTGNQRVKPEDVEPEFLTVITEIAESAGIKVYAELPPEGERDGQIVMIVPPGQLYRWDATLGGWVTDVYAGLPDGYLTIAKFAQGIEPITIIEDTDPLPTVKSTESIFWQGNLYRWSGTAYIKSIPTTDLVGTITSDQIGTGAVLTDKLAANAVTVAKVANAAIEAAKLATNAVTSDKIAALAVNSAKLADNAVTVGKVADAAIEAAKLAAGAVTEVKVATGAITTTKIADDSVSTAKLIALSITAAKIATDTITADKIAANAVTASEIAAGAVTAGKIAANAVTAAEIAAGTITATEIASNAITTIKLAAGAVTTAKLTANAVTANEIAANAVTTAKIAAGAVTANEIAAGTITANELAANSVTTVKIAAGSVTAAEIAANAVTTAKIAAGAVTANELAANSVIAGKIAAGAVSAAEIAAGAIVASKLAVVAFDNIVPDADFSEFHGGGSTWISGGGGGVFQTFNVAGNTVWAGPYIMRLNISGAGGTGYSGVQSSDFTVTGGLDYNVTALLQTQGSGGANVILRLRWFDNAGVSLGQSNIYSGTANLGVDRKTANVAAPSAAAKARLQLYIRNDSVATYVQMGSLAVRKAAGGELIVDGVVTSSKVATGAIEANNIAANAIVASKIAAGVIGTDKLAANAVTAEKIATGTITAASGIIANAAILTANIADGAITNAKIANAAIDSAQIANAAITNAKIANLSIDTGKIADDSLTTMDAISETDINQSAVGTWQDLLSITKTINVGDKILINAGCIIPFSSLSSAASRAGVRILLNGATIPGSRVDGYNRADYPDSSFSPTIVYQRVKSFVSTGTTLQVKFQARQYQGISSTFQAVGLGVLRAMK